MVPTIHREGGFHVVIYFDDHEPAHVHVWKAGEVARIRIENAGGAVDGGSMRPAALRRAVRIVSDNRAFFLREWRKIHGAETDASER